MYAGDCPANNPAEIDPSQITESSISVALEPGEDPTIKVPTSEVSLTAYKGAKGAKLEPETIARPVKITNTECLKIKEKEEEKNKTTYLPNNASKYSVIHTQNTTSTGTLEVPYQPFGKSFKLCLWDEKEHKTYTTTYADEKILGTKIFLYLGEYRRNLRRWQRPQRGSEEKPIRQHMLSKPPHLGGPATHEHDPPSPTRAATA